MKKANKYKLLKTSNLILTDTSENRKDETLNHNYSETSFKDIVEEPSIRNKKYSSSLLILKISY